MRFLFGTTLILGLWIGTSVAQATPPSGDMLGSDRSMAPAGLGNQPTNDPQNSQRMTGTEGSTTGFYDISAFAGRAGYDDRTNTGNPSSAGASYGTVISTTRAGGAEQRVSQGALQSGDNGSVWNANTTRASNVVARLSGAASKPGQAASATQSGVKDRKTPTH